MKGLPTNLTLINSASARFNNKIVEATANNGDSRHVSDPAQYWTVSKMPPRPYQRRPVIEENENEIQLNSPTVYVCVCAGFTLLRFLAPPHRPRDVA